jgi:hypothetical protein
MLRIFFLGATALVAFGISHADAALMISNKPTRNVACSAGVCAATRVNAVLNAADLATMLAASDVRVSSGSNARDIDVTAAFAWASTHRLTLDAFRAIAVTAPVQVTGTGAMTITTNDGGSGGAFDVVAKGSIGFLDTSSNLAINGESYKLEASLSALSSAVAANQSGNFAFARSYDAGPDGVYPQNPITSVFVGRLEGLGNTITRMKIKNTDVGGHVGMFYATGPVSNLNFTHASVKGGKEEVVGVLAGLCAGNVANVTVSGKVTAGRDGMAAGVCGALAGDMTNVHASGTVTGTGSNGSSQNWAGGLTGLLDGGTISASSSSAKITGAKGWVIGGLIGQSQGTITGSFATGVVSTGDNGVAGGLVGNNIGTSIANSYATGFTLGGVSSTVGGLIGKNDGAVSDSYSSGPVVSGSGNAVGGFVGNDLGAADLTDTYFDITTSGQSHGVGNNTAYPGITGLTTEQFQAGLPSGFDPQIWAEAPGINGGLPYLPANPQ